MCIYRCICAEGPAQLCAPLGFAPPAPSGKSPGCCGGKVNHGVLLYFSPWLSPSVTSSGGWEDSMWVLLHVEMFGVSLPMPEVRKRGPHRHSSGCNEETQMEKEEEKPQAQHECLREPVKARVPSASPEVPLTFMPSTFDKTRLQQIPHSYSTGCLSRPFLRLLPESRRWALGKPLA